MNWTTRHKEEDSTLLDNTISKLLKTKINIIKMADL